MSVSVELPPQQKKVLLHLGSGLQAKEIAEKMNLSYWTVETYKREIFAKLGASNTPHAIVLAFLNGALKMEEFV